MSYMRRILSAHETFMRAVPQPAPRMRVEKDLFEGIE
jgi:hypothetical protein